jgi:MFS family permease
MGGDESLAGLIIGMNSVAALVSTLIYSYWTSWLYHGPLICATLCQIAGDVVYALALPLGGSLKLVMLGRLLSGFGSARAINRRYIADNFSSHERTAASAMFVTAGKRECVSFH